MCLGGGSGCSFAFPLSVFCLVFGKDSLEEEKLGLDFVGGGAGLWNKGDGL